MDTHKNTNKYKIRFRRYTPVKFSSSVNCVSIFVVVLVNWNQTGDSVNCARIWTHIELTALLFLLKDILNWLKDERSLPSLLCLSYIDYKSGLGHWNTFAGTISLPWWPCVTKNVPWGDCSTISCNRQQTLCFHCKNLDFIISKK